MTDDEKWLLDRRAELPVCADYAYLNSGTAGPIPLPSAKAMREENQFELAHGRGNFATIGRLMALVDQTRQHLARLLNASTAEIALTHHTSDGINIVLNGIDWRSGDEIVTTTLEHDAVAVPLGLLAKRRQVKVHFVDVGLGTTTRAAIAAALSERTRLVIISHVVYSSGALLPASAIVSAAHAAGAQVLVDGAQSAGAMPIDVKALGTDYFTVSGQKWLCGPEGVGALYLAEEAASTLSPAATSYLSAADHDFLGEVTLHGDARRFEVAMIHRPSLAAFNASLAWILDVVGLDRAWCRSLQLAARARAKLERLSGVEIVTPASAPSQLLAFDLPEFSPAQLSATAMDLGERAQIICRSVDHPPYGIRLSLGFFNTEAEVERLVAAIAHRLERGPGDLQIRGWALRAPETRMRR